MQKTSSDLALLVARIAMSALFIPGGLRKLTDLAAFAASLHKQGVPFADVLSPVGACVDSSAASPSSWASSCASRRC